jgi:hypothetical protein
MISPNNKMPVASESEALSPRTVSYDDEGLAAFIC